MTTWRAMIESEMREHGEALADIEASAPPAGPWVDVEISPGSWVFNGAPITIWTARRVYYATGVDTEEWIDSVPRHPGPEAYETSELARWRR